MRNQCLKRKRRRMGNGNKTTTNGEDLHGHQSLPKEARAERLKAVKDQDGEMTVYVSNGQTSILVKVEKVKRPKDGIVVTIVRNGIVIMMNMMMMIGLEPISQHGVRGKSLVTPHPNHQQ